MIDSNDNNKKGDLRQSWLVNTQIQNNALRR